MPRLRLALAAALAAGACDGSTPATPPELGPAIVHEEVAADLIELFARSEPAVAVLAQDAEKPLACYPFRLGKDALASDEMHRVLRAHAESAFEVRLPALPAGARLAARTFVYSAFPADPQRADPAPVTFRVLVDGVERVSQSSDYILRPEDRKNPYDVAMRDFSVPLESAAGRAVTLRFETTRAGRPVPAGAQPAEPLWWDLRVLQPAAVPREAATPRDPNLLLLVVDTLAANHTSLFGAKRDTTPHLRELAARGLLFTRAISTSSWTLPATASLLTGLPPNTHGVLGNERSYLMTGLRTVGEVLREHGLDSAAISANPLLAPSDGFDQGFGHFELADAGGPGETAAQLNARLLAWLDAQPRGARWFAWVQYMDPHAPYAAPGDARLKYSDDYKERRDFTHLLPNQLQRKEIPPLTPDEQVHVADLYDAEVAYFDDCLGALLGELSRRGLLDTTLIVVTADHGEELFDHGQLGHGYTLYDELLHVPLVLAGPRVPSGSRCEVPVSSSALAATLMAFVGATEAGTEPPLLPLPAASPGPVFSTVRTELFGPRHVLDSGEDGDGRKLILVHDEAGALVEVLRFDHRTDPREQHPLAVESLSPGEGAAFDALQQAIVAWAARTAAASPPEPQPLDPEMARRMAEIGYTRGKPH